MAVEIAGWDPASGPGTVTAELEFAIAFRLIHSVIVVD